MICKDMKEKGMAKNPGHERNRENRMLSQTPKLTPVGGAHIALFKTGALEEGGQDNTTK